MSKKWRNILLPFSLIYSGIIRGRNRLYDKQILRSASFDFPLLCVGNLALGGTGKTPMVEYLVKMLQEDYKVATLSRGYKRKTKGFFIANEKTGATDIGDEPMQIHQKFPQVTVSVAEERVMGIPQLLLEKPETEVVILDDAFQHREVKAGLNILLTEYNHLYSDDYLLPAGNLRDSKTSSKRAQIIVVTKCKSDLKKEDKNKIINELKALPEQKVYFTKITYKNPYHLFSKEELVLGKNIEVLLVTGIANPKRIEELLKDKVMAYDLMRFKDHYNFHSDDIKEIINRFSKKVNPKKIILTTEKDAVRLFPFENEFSGAPIFVLPMEHEFLFNASKEFEEDVMKFIESFENLRR
ncbi:MAG: tetraacyldisaccharide 4'-kinase [Ginsengibacter sp.]